jgi:hypothetical protein
MAQLVKIFLAFYATQRFIAVFKRACISDPYPELVEFSPNP